MIQLILLMLLREEARKREMSSPAPKLKPWKKPVSLAITEWAKGILADVKGHPMGSTETKTFAEGTVAARVEKHTWTYRQGKLVHGDFRGVTLYEA